VYTEINQKIQRGVNRMTGLIAVIMVFSIPLAAIITSHLQTQTKLKSKMIESQLELEKLKHENFVIETQKMRLELEQMKLEDAKKGNDFLLK
jgi:uncharacterized membrane protein YciS (DUF1049 family)